jgi:hypothetical protein
MNIISKINLLKYWINVIFKNNTMIKVLAIELLNRISIFAFLMIKISLLKKLWCALTFLAPCSAYCELEKVENLCSTGI